MKTTKTKLLLLLTIPFFLHSCGGLIDISPDISGSYMVNVDIKAYENEKLVLDQEFKNEELDITKYGRGFSISNYVTPEGKPIEVKPNFGKISNMQIVWVDGCRYKRGINGKIKKGEIEYTLTNENKCGDDKVRIEAVFKGTIME